MGLLGLYISLLTTAWVEMAWLGMGMGTPVHDSAGSDTVRIGIMVWAFGKKGMVGTLDTLRRSTAFSCNSQCVLYR